MFRPMFNFWNPDNMEMFSSTSGSSDESGDDCPGDRTDGKPRCRRDCQRRCQGLSDMSDGEVSAPEGASPGEKPSRRHVRFLDCPPGDRERMWPHMKRQWRRRQMMARFMRHMGGHHGFMHGPHGPYGHPGPHGPHGSHGPHRSHGHHGHHGPLGPHHHHGPHGSHHFVGGPHGFMGGPHAFMGGPHAFMGGPHGFMGGPHCFVGGPYELPGFMGRPHAFMKMKKSFWVERVPIGQNFTHDQVHVTVAEDKVIIITKNDSGEKTRNDVSIPEDVDNSSVKTCVRPKKGFVIIAGKKKGDNSGDPDTSGWENGCHFGRWARWAKNMSTKQRRNARWMERIYIGPGFQREQVQVSIETDKVTIHAKNHTADSLYEVTKHVPIPKNVDRATVGNCIRPQMGFVFVFGKKNLTDLQMDTENNDAGMDVDVCCDPENIDDQELDKCNYTTGDAIQNADDPFDQELNSCKEGEDFEDLSQDVSEICSGFVNKLNVDNDKTWILNPGQGEKEQSFSLDVNVSPFTPDEVKVKVVGQEVMVTANHAESKEGHSIEKKLERKYRLPNYAEAKAVSSRVTPDGILKITVPTHAEKGLLLTSQNSKE